MDSQRVHSEVVAVGELCPNTVDQLYGLYQQCYDGAERSRFDADLGEKQWIILLREAAASVIVGFSTQMLIDVEVDGKPLRALFSGDTVIHPNYWGSQELVRAWCRLAGRLKARTLDRPLYWFLISKGYRTYLYLPYFFRHFYPRYDHANPVFIEQLICALGAVKYPGEFNPNTGLIEHQKYHDRLKRDLDGTARRLNNPHVEFFIRRNPNYQSGAELLCVAEISAENMRATARRELEIGLCSAESRIATQ